MNKKGFTLVELMVVIVIIGVLAAVAIPKMMSATNKAKAGEGPQILRAIGNLQAAYKAENNTYVNLEKSNPSAGNSGWTAIGFEQVPNSRTFNFEATTTPSVTASATHEYTSFADSFLAKAILLASLGKAIGGKELTLDESDTRSCNDDELQLLVPNWRSASTAP